MWTYRKLRDHIRTHCEDAGYPGLTKLSANTVYSIPDRNEIKPNKINYYLVRKDPDFGTKMHDVLVVYKQIEMCFDDEGRFPIDMDAPKTVTLSYDEKPGIQALKNIVSDLLPTKKHGTIGNEFLELLETTQMTKSYKMTVLLAFYNNGNIKMEI